MLVYYTEYEVRMTLELHESGFLFSLNLMALSK